MEATAAMLGRPRTPRTQPARRTRTAATAGGSPSTPVWAGTRRSSPMWSGAAPLAGRPHRCGTRGTALRHYLHQRRRPPSMTVEMLRRRAGRRTCELTFVCTTDTWTYLGSRAVRTNPGTSIGAGLGLFGLREPRCPGPSPGRCARDARARTAIRAAGTCLRHDAVAQVTVRSVEGPMALQLDGEHLGRRHEVRIPSRDRCVTCHRVRRAARRSRTASAGRSSRGDDRRPLADARGPSSRSGLAPGQTVAHGGPTDKRVIARELLAGSTGRSGRPGAVGGTGSDSVG